MQKLRVLNLGNIRLNTEEMEVETLSVFREVLLAVQNVVEEFHMNEN